MSSLNRREEVDVPSLPFEFTKTPTPPADVWPNILAIKQLRLALLPAASRSYADNVAGIRNVGASALANENIEIAIREIASGSSTHGRVGIPSGEVKKGVGANGHIAAAEGEIKERLIPKSIVGAGVRTTGMCKGLKADSCANTQIGVIESGGIAAKRSIAYGGVAAGDGVVLERLLTDCHVGADREVIRDAQSAAGGVVKKRVGPNGGVAAGGVAIKRKGAHRGVVVAGEIIDKRGCSIGCIVRACRIQQQRRSAGRCVVISRVGGKGKAANTGVKTAGGNALERKRANCCVGNAAGKVKKSVLPFCGSEVGISSIRRPDLPPLCSANAQCR